MSKAFEEIRGTLYINSNNGTDSIKIHPIKAGNWVLVPTDLTEEQKRHQHHYVSHIEFDKWQVWEVCYYIFGNDKIF